MYRSGGGSRMPAVGTGSVDVRNILNSIVNFVKSKANTVCTAPCDGVILKMHYRWTFFIFIGTFFAVWYQWYARDVITCVTHFNADTQVRLDYVNICLSYPYLDEGQDENGKEKRRYILFYRWIQWSFFVLAGIYYIPRKMSKHWENPKCKKLIEELACNSYRYDNAEQTLLDKVVLYMVANIRTHDILYIKYIALNVVALFIDIVTMQYFDFLLQGRFLRYGIDAYPFERDPDHFTDYMSQMFPPFVMCNINEQKKLVGQRSEKLGCHLTIMELYEKIFLLIWLWMIIMITFTTIYIIVLVLGFIPKFRELWLRTSKPNQATGKANSLIKAASNKLRIGDCYLLYRFKSHLSHARFYDLLTRITDMKSARDLPSEVTDLKQNQKQITQNGLKPNQEGGANTRNRKGQPGQPGQPQQPQQPAVNPQFMNQMYANPNTLARHGQVGDPSQRQPLLGNKNGNTSILIE